MKIPSVNPMIVGGRHSPFLTQLGFGRNVIGGSSRADLSLAMLYRILRNLKPSNDGDKVWKSNTSKRGPLRVEMVDGVDE